MPAFVMLHFDVRRPCYINVDKIAGIYHSFKHPGSAVVELDNRLEDNELEVVESPEQVLEAIDRIETNAT
jgi:hypothetical protein